MSLSHRLSASALVACGIQNHNRAEALQQKLVLLIISLQV